jgi:hypothetical protein
LSDGEDIRKLPLSMRKASLAQLLARRVDGIFLSDFEQGEIGPTCSATPACWGWKAWSPSTASPARCLRRFRDAGRADRSRPIPRRIGSNE